jgi:hypothetical protein
MRGFSTGHAARLNCGAALVLSCAFALLLAGCTREAAPPKPPPGDPLATDQLPVVLSRSALVIQDQARGIGTLFNQATFAERKREAERVKTEHEATIEKLKKEIEERFAYVNAIEALKNNIEEDSANLPPYYELVLQIPARDATGEQTRKVAAVWTKLERRAEHYRRFAEDICAGEMARKYLSLSDQVQNAADEKVRSALTGLYNSFKSISKNYGTESNVARLEQQLADINKLAQTLTWVGAEYCDLKHALYRKKMQETGTTVGPAPEGKELFSTSFDELMADIDKTRENIRKHIAVCKVYNDCLDRVERLLENGLQASDVAIIDGLKEQLADMRPNAPNEDSRNLLERGRRQIEDAVERELDRMRSTRDQLDQLCQGEPDFASPERYLERLRKGQDDLHEMATIFYELNLADDARKASQVRDHAIRIERAFDKLRQLHQAYQEMQGYQRDLQQMPAYHMRSAAQQQRAEQIREKIEDYKIRFTPWFTDPTLQESADKCLTLIDTLNRQIGG